MRGWARRVILGLGLLLEACTRRAPGPEECAEVARICAEHDTHHIAAQSSGKLQVVVREQDVAERAHVCLTTPFDRELHECVRGRRDARHCLYRFRARHRRLQEEDR